MTNDFHHILDDDRAQIGVGAVLLRRRAAGLDRDLLAAVEAVAGQAAFRHMTTPGGFQMSAAMTNCGAWGWVTDRAGYRYAGEDPLTGQPWPALPPAIAGLAAAAAAAAGFPGFRPDACLINRYRPGDRMALHQDRDEAGFDHPIVSVSLGLPVIFQFGGLNRTDRPRRIVLGHGDVVVWGGPSRLAFHGVLPLKDGDHPVLGRCRINLTLRRAH